MLKKRASGRRQEELRGHANPLEQAGRQIDLYTKLRSSPAGGWLRVATTHRPGRSSPDSEGFFDLFRLGAHGDHLHVYYQKNKGIC